GIATCEQQQRSCPRTTIYAESQHISSAPHESWEYMIVFHRMAPAFQVHVGDATPSTSSPIFSFDRDDATASRLHGIVRSDQPQPIGAVERTTSSIRSSMVSRAPWARPTAKDDNPPLGSLARKSPRMTGESSTSTTMRPSLSSTTICHSR